MRRSAVLALLAFCGLAAQAQLLQANPDWKEDEAPPPPALKTDKLLPLDMQNSVLRWGIDPDSISVGSDGVVRYVVVARAAGGAFNALYEGLRCDSGEVKVYARHAGDRWQVARNAEWKPIWSNAATRHTLRIAREGACMGRTPNLSADQIARELGSAGERR